MNKFLKRVAKELRDSLIRLSQGYIGCALSAATGFKAYDIAAAVKKLDLSEELAEIIRTDNVALLNRIGAGGLVADQLTHKWPEDKLNPNTATSSDDADGTLGASDADTSLNVTADQGTERFKIGTLFKDNTAGKTEVMRVTNVANDTLTIERGHGSTSAEAHAQNFPIMIISHTKQESWKPTQEDWSLERTGPYNYLTTFGLGIAITRRRQAVSHAGVPSEFAHQAAYRLKEIMRQLDSSIVNSIRSATEGGAADYSSMGGLIEFASAAGGNIDSTSEAITPSVLNALIKLIWDDGGMVAGGRLFCLVGGVQKRKISAFDQAYRRLDYDSRAAGYVVERFLSDLGFEVEIIVDPWVPDDTVIVGDLNRLRVGPLNTDAISLEDLAKTGRLIEAMVSGSYTMEVRNALEAFAFHNALTS